MSQFNKTKVRANSGRHDLKGRDFIVCWTHNWPSYPVVVVVVELSKVALGK